MLINEFNLNGLNSELKNNLDCLDNINLPIKINDSQLKEFNSRKITPENINKIIEVCDYLLISDTENFILKNCIPIETNYILDEAYSNKIKLPKFMTGEINCDDIVEEGYLDWLIFAHKNGYEWCNKTCRIAAYNNRLDCLKYLFENNCPFGNESCKEIFSNWNPDVIELYYHSSCNIFQMSLLSLVEKIKRQQRYNEINSYVKKYGLFYYKENICSAAALAGNLECLKFAYENGSLLSDKTALNAAKKGHTDCLNFALNNGCVKSIKISLKAAENNNVEALKCAIENGCKLYCKDEDLSVVEVAVTKGHLEILEFLDTIGYNFSEKYHNIDLIKESISFGYYDIFEFLIDKKCIGYEYYYKDKI